MSTFILVLFVLQSFSALSLVQSYQVTLNTGYKIPLIGLGTYLINGTEKTDQVIDDALAAGYRLFDTAHIYHNEHFLGQSFKKLLPKHNLRREDIFITTKIVPSPDHKTDADFTELLRRSLTSLQTNYIDLFLIHWPGATGVDNSSPDLITYRHSAWDALVKFQKMGYIRSIGVSNFLIKHLEDLKKVSNVIPAVNQIEWHPQLHDDRLLNYCRRNNILVQAYSSLGSSFRTSLRENPTVVYIAKKLNKSPAQILLRWAYQQSIAIVPKASSKKHIVENISLNFSIPDEDMAALSNFQQNQRIYWDPTNIV